MAAALRQRIRWLAVSAAALAIVGPCAYALDRISSYRIEGFPSVRSPSLLLDIKQALGLQSFYSQLGQDKWVTGTVFHGLTDGYFVDVGSWDAVQDSNSKALEELGWKGICIDPFPANWRDRTCRLFEEVAYSREGEVVRFRKAGALGGIDQHIDVWKHVVESRPVVEFTTTTLADVLERAEAPRFIHYVSIDTEGSELEVLKGFPFSDYRVGAFTIEHNGETHKRQQIRALLEGHGYRFVREQLVDDWYIGPTPGAHSESKKSARATPFES